MVPLPYRTRSSPTWEAPTAWPERDFSGEMAERFKAPVLKTGEGSNLPWVRIPLSPPFLVCKCLNCKAITGAYWGRYAIQHAIRCCLGYRAVRLVMSLAQHVGLEAGSSCFSTHET